MERKPTELWLALRDLYAWRKLASTKSLSSTVYDRIHNDEYAEFIEERYPYHKMAYDLWKRHKSEDTFFALNHFKPDESED
jgi:hypothetical protein